jgi:uncharacterized membrane protein required for colicin V production
VNLFDLVVVVLVVVALVVGFRSGALPQLSGLAGALIGGTAALIALPHLKEPLEGLELSVRAFVVLAGLLFAVGIGEAIGSAIGRTAATFLGQGVFGALDRTLGAIVGGAQALLIVWLTGGLLASGPSQALAAQAQTSVVVRAMNGLLPARANSPDSSTTAACPSCSSDSSRCRLRLSTCPTIRSSSGSRRPHSPRRSRSRPRPASRCRRAAASSSSVATSSRTPT